MLSTRFFRAVKDHLHALLIVFSALTPGLLCAQERVIIEHHAATPEGDLIRAKADAALLLKQAELVGERAQAQRLANMMTDCDVRYKQMVARNKTKGTLETKYERTFDVIRFNQQLADIREELEHKALMRRTRVGDPTGEMNSLLEQFARQPTQADHISAMKMPLTPEQLDALFLTDGSNVFSGKTGKTKLEAFRWPFFIQRKEFEEERTAFDAACDQAVKEIDAGGSLSPETVLDLLKKVAAIEEKVNSLPLSEYASVRSMETKWRTEAKAFLRDLNQTLGNCSKLDSERLAKYAFHGKTLGELIDHLNAKGLRFSQPGRQDANLYASIFFLMRYAYQDFEKGPTEQPAIASGHREPASPPASHGESNAPSAVSPAMPDASTPKAASSRVRIMVDVYQNNRDFYNAARQKWLPNKNWSWSVVDQPLTSHSLSTADILVVTHCGKPKTYSLKECRAAVDFVREGGGLLIAGLTWVGISYGKYTEADYPPNQLGTQFGLLMKGNYAGNAARFASHQVVQGLANLNWPKNVEATSSSIVVSYGATPVIYDSEGHVVCAVREYGKGRVCMMSSHFTTWSSDQRFPQYQQLLQQVFLWLAQGHRAAGSSTAQGTKETAGGEKNRPEGMPSSDVQWLNTSYDNTLVHVGEAQWIETDNKTGKTTWHFTEAGHNRRYLELKRTEVEPNRLRLSYLCQPRGCQKRW